MRYAPLADFVAPARVRAELWRTLLGLLLIAVLSLALALGVTAALAWWGPRDWLSGGLGAGLPSGPSAPSAGLGTTPGGVLAILASFAAPLAALALVLRLLHRRGLSSVIGPARAFGRDAWRCVWRLVLLGAVLALIPLPQDGAGPEGEPLRQMEILVWAGLLLPGLAGVVLQTGTEEAVFRGYLLQQLAARFARRAIWLVLPAVLFGLLHYDPNQPGLGLVQVLWATGFGLAAADLTARAGNLGPALALHVVNNAVAILVIAVPGHLSGLALWLHPFDREALSQMQPLLAVDLAFLLASWLTCRLALRR